MNGIITSIITSRLLAFKSFNINELYGGRGNNYIKIYMREGVKKLWSPLSRVSLYLI